MIASCFALLAFVAAVVVGFAAGNELATIVWRAICVMGCCWLIGRIVGAIAQRTVERHIAQFKQDHPIPEDVTLDELIARQEAEHAQRANNQGEAAAPAEQAAAA